jgi:hypothetical protein
LSTPSQAQIEVALTKVDAKHGILANYFEPPSKSLFIFLSKQSDDGQSGQCCQPQSGHLKVQNFWDQDRACGYWG